MFHRIENMLHCVHTCIQDTVNIGCMKLILCKGMSQNPLSSQILVLDDYYKIDILIPIKNLAHVVLKAYKQRSHNSMQVR